MAYPVPDPLVEDGIEPNANAEGDGGPMSEEDIQRIVHAALTDAIQFVDGTLSPARAKATDYYKGEKFGDEEEGRSQVVSTDVRDSVASVMPSILRVVFGPERVVEYVPKKADKVEDAKQQTDYIFHVLEQEDGFLKVHAVLKDGLIGGLGAMKWWWEEAETQVVKMDGLSREQVEQLAADSSLEINSVQERMPRRQMVTKVKQAIGLLQPDAPVYDVEVTQYESEGHLRFEPTPPEEFVFSRMARGLHHAMLVGHRTEKTRSELIEMGLDPEDIDENASSGLFAAPEEVARRDGLSEPDPEAGEANDRILYCEAYLHIDVDGDGIAELRKVCTLGPHYKVVQQEPADEIPFAIFSPDPTPHVLHGEAWSARTMDIQHINSHLLRAIFDSAGFAVFPRTVVLRGEANMEDVMNTEIGATIREYKPNAVRVLEHRFVGGDLLPLITLMHDITERRTGRNKAAAGLDADALQSTTKSAADAAVQGSAEQVELLVRVFCEQLLKPMFRGMRRLTVKHQPRRQMMRLRGQWVEIDPKNWEEDCDVAVNVALGSTLSQMRPQALGVILQKQEQILQLLGLDQPMVSASQYANTCRRLVETMGFKDVDSFFSAVKPDWKPEPKEPQKSPEQVIAEAQLQIEKMKTERELQIKEAELSLKQAQGKEDMALEIAKLAVDETLKRLQINAQFGAQITQQQLEQEAKAQDTYLEAERLGYERAKAEMDAAVEMRRQDEEREMREKELAAEKQKPKSDS